MVHDPEFCIADYLVADVFMCHGLGLPDTQQMVLDFERGFQRGDILVPRAVQDIDLCVQSYSLHCPVDHQINRARSIKGLIVRGWSGFSC